MPHSVDGYPDYSPRGHYKRPVKFLLIPAACACTPEEYKEADKLTAKPIPKPPEKHTFIGFIPFKGRRHGT